MTTGILVVVLQIKSLIALSVTMTMLMSKMDISVICTVVQAI